MDTLPHRIRKIVIRDLNAKIGKADVFKPTKDESLRKSKEIYKQIWVRQVATQGIRSIMWLGKSHSWYAV